MRILTCTMAIMVMATAPAWSAQGDQWILGIHHLDNSGAFAVSDGAGYDGPQSSGDEQFVGNAYRLADPSSRDGVARVYWELSGLSVNNDTPVPTTTELYTVEFYAPTDIGHNSWQPVESQFNGVDGETFPIEPNIPWAGAFGTNHQSLAGDGFDDGQWHQLGPGNQAPESEDFNAGPAGTYMWLTSDSWLYAKWDFPFDIDRSWSALRVTQVTGAPPIPEPGSMAMAALALGGLGLVVRRRRRALQS